MLHSFSDLISIRNFSNTSVPQLSTHTFIVYGLQARELANLEIICPLHPLWIRQEAISTCTESEWPPPGIHIPRLLRHVNWTKGHGGRPGTSHPARCHASGTALQVGWRGTIHQDVQHSHLTANLRSKARQSSVTGRHWPWIQVRASHAKKRAIAALSRNAMRKGRYWQNLF